MHRAGLRLELGQRLALLSLCSLLLSGCLTTGLFDFLHSEQFQEVAPEMERTSSMEFAEPQVETPETEQVRLSQSPRTLWHQGNQSIKNISLEEVIFLALQNNKIIRTVAGQSPNNTLLNNPDNVPSVFDPAILDSGILFGRRGVDAALSDFDVQASTSMFWGRNEQVVNALPAGGNNVAETGTFNSQIAKAFGTGGSLTLRHNWNYLGTNNPGVLFPSTYTGLLSATYRHPLMAGSGTEYTRIAGPRNPQAGFLASITGVSQGVVIARINADMTLADFENNVRNMLLAVENAYWDLYLQYCLYDTSVAARKSAFESWDRVRKLRENKEDEPQARDRYYETQAQVEDALTSIYIAEARLRQLLNLAVNDNEIFRPSTEPSIGRFHPDWATNVAEALVNRPELRKQKWSIKSLELQLKAAKNLTRPSLDFVGSYQVNAFGDHLFGESDNDNIPGTQGLRSAYETLTQGNHTGWTLGFEFGLPLGLRSAHSQVRNLELRLFKARKTLEAQEIDISHELANSYQSLVKEYATAESNYRRLQAALELEDVLQKKLRRGSGGAGAAGQGVSVIDRLIRAQESVARAKSAYCISLVNYNKALLNLKYYKGTLLRDYNVHLAEGPWTHAAYHDAYRKALRRTSAKPNSHLTAKPAEFALPLGSTVHGVDGPVYDDGTTPMILPGETSDGLHLPAPENAYDQSTEPPTGNNLPAPGEPRNLNPTPNNPTPNNPTPDNPMQNNGNSEPALPPVPPASPESNPLDDPGADKEVPVPEDNPPSIPEPRNDPPPSRTSEQNSGPILRISSQQQMKSPTAPAVHTESAPREAFQVPTLTVPQKPASKWRKRTK